MHRTVIIIITLITGLIFIAGDTPSFAAAPQTQASKKSSWKKPQSKKRQA
jgi:hypothetical protein